MLREWYREGKMLAYCKLPLPCQSPRPPDPSDYLQDYLQIFVNLKCQVHILSPIHKWLESLLLFLGEEWGEAENTKHPYHPVLDRWAHVFRAHRRRVFFFKSTADEVLAFDWNASSCQVPLL